MCLHFYVCLQGIKGIFYDSPSQFFLFFWVKIHITKGINNFIARDNPVRSYHQGHRDDGTYMSSGNTASLQLFG